MIGHRTLPFPAKFHVINLTLRKSTNTLETVLRFKVFVGNSCRNYQYISFFKNDNFTLVTTKLNMRGAFINPQYFMGIAMIMMTIRQGIFTTIAPVMLLEELYNSITCTNVRQIKDSLV